MDSTKLDNRIEHFQARLSESLDCEDKNDIQCQLLNLRFLMRLKKLKERTHEIQNSPSSMDFLKRHLHFIF